MNKFLKQATLLILIVCFVIVVGIGMGIGGYLYGKNKGEDNMRNDLEEKYDEDISAVKADCKTEKDDIKKLYQERIDELKSDLNNDSNSSSDNEETIVTPSEEKIDNSKN